MTNKDLIIIALVIAIIYLYYQNRKQKRLSANADNSATIYELDEDLIAEKDEAIRKKNEAEAENLSLSNKLKLKNQEISRKEQEIERLKKEKSKVEIALNEKIKELKTELNTKNSQWTTNRVTELETSLRAKEGKIQDLEKTIRELKK